MSSTGPLRGWSGYGFVRVAGNLPSDEFSTNKLVSILFEPKLTYISLSFSIFLLYFIFFLYFILFLFLNRKAMKVFSPGSRARFSFNFFFHFTKDFFPFPFCFYCFKINTLSFLFHKHRLLTCVLIPVYDRMILIRKFDKMKKCEHFYK